jgi:hypothetical protein
MKTRFYIPNHKDDIGEAITKMVEQEANGKIFTMRINEVEDGLEALIVLEDKRILHGIITVMTVNNKLAPRLQLNYI